MIATKAAVQQLQKLWPMPQPPSPYLQYRNDPVGFFRDVLRVKEITPQQKAIAEATLQPPYRVLAPSSHTVGKTCVEAMLALWWHLTRVPSIVITTAPKLEQVRDLLWKEIRRLSRPLRLRFDGPRATCRTRAADDFMIGTTAATGTHFQGHHGAEMLFLVDEAVGVRSEIIEVIETMFAGEGHAWVCAYNPTDSTSAVYRCEQARDEDGRALWTVLPMSAVEHPNIAAELAGRPAPIPSAIRLGRLNDMLSEWCESVDPGLEVSTDIEWPPGSGRYLRPGPIAEARLLGRWPSATCGVWSDALWKSTLCPLPWPADCLPVIGCDVARFGDDNTAIHVRLGGVSLHHESHNGWDGAQTVGRLKQLCQEWAERVTEARDPAEAPIDPCSVPVNVDQDGMGGLGVTDHAGEYNFRDVSAASVSKKPGDYHRLRDELWFGTASRARKGMLSFAALSRDTQARIQQQLLAPVYWLNPDGTRQVEAKADTKQKLGRSPDDADAVNLAYHEGDFEAPTRVGEARERSDRLRPSHESAQARRGLFGRKRR